MNRMEEESDFNKPAFVKPDLPSPSPSSSRSSQEMDMGMSGFDSKTMIILLLIFFIVLSFVGMNLITSLGNFIQSIIEFFNPIIIRFLNALGYSAGTALDKVSDVTAEVAKGGIDLADGAINNIGGLLKGSGPDPALELEKKNTPPLPPSPSPSPSPPPPPANTPTKPPPEPSADTSENAIQKPITSDKWNWCLVGEYQNKRGCVEITNSDKCMSGQVFPSQQMCLNPTWTP